MKTERPTKKEQKIDLLFDAKVGLLEVEVFHGKSISNADFTKALQEIENTLQFHKEITIVFCTADCHAKTMEFMLQAIKMIERYEWLEGNDVKIHWKQKRTIDRERSRLRIANYLDAVLRNAQVSYGALV